MQSRRANKKTPHHAGLNRELHRPSVAATLPVMMDVHLVAHDVVMVVGERGRHAAESGCSGNQRQKNLLHPESSKTKTKGAAIVARLYYDLLKKGGRPV
jgi:DNA-binding cell septation regulator SpoVG